MGQYIICGEINKNIKYIILTSFFLFLTNLFYGFKLNNNFDTIRIFNSDQQEYLFRHTLIHSIIRYFAIIILSFIFYKYETNIFSKTKRKTKTKINNKKSDKNLNNSSTKIIYIHYSESVALKNNNHINIFLLIVLWIIQIILMDLFYKCGLRDLDYWMLELIIVSRLIERMFHLEIYKHQKFGIYFNIIFCGIFKIFSFSISFFYGINDNDNDLPYIKNYWLIPIGIFSYIIIMTLRSFINCEIKCLIDIKYISPLKLLILFGIVGFLISSTVSTISTFFTCKTPNFLDICHVNTTEEKYFENFEIYYNTLTEQLFNNRTIFIKELFFEISVNILGMISNFFNILFYVLTIKHLTPVHIIFSNSIYYFIIQISILIHYLITKNENIEKKVLFKHIIDIIEDFFSLFGFMVYLEIIELHFCGLNYDLRKNITSRSILDSNININIPIDEELINDKEYQESKESSFSSEQASKSSISASKAE